MRNLNLLLSAVVIILFSTSCKQSNERPNGWYFITSNTTDSLSSKPIVTVTDFETIKLDSFVTQDHPVQYEIVGKLKAEKSKDFADATEKSIGHPIGFLYNGKIICSPVPNARIESGNFSITPPELYTNKDEMIRIYDDLKKEMEMS